MTARSRGGRRHEGAVVLGACPAGSVPFSPIAARFRAGADLRNIGRATVPGSAR